MNMNMFIMNSCLATTRSTNLDMKLRPDTGRVFKIICRKSSLFNKRSIYTAVLKPSGTQPSMNEQLTNFVIDGKRMSLHSLMRNVGHGSNRQDFVGEFLMILSNSILRNFSKGNNFRRIRRRMNILFSARGDESISNCLDFIMEKGGKLISQCLVRLVRWKCHFRDPTQSFLQHIPYFSRVLTIIRDKFTVVV